MKKTLRNLALVALATAPFSAYAEIAGTGTEADPYQIATAADLQKCWELTKAGEMVYFVQTADIDMAGVTDWHAFVGGDNNTYSSQITYDGQNHVIRNFTSTSNEAYNADKKNCYVGSIFGVLNGTVMNLGVVNANIKSAQGCGILGGYAGHHTGTEATVDNVFVTGTIETSYYGGGMFGTMGNKLMLSNSFANVKITGTEPTKRQIGGIVGRTDNVASLTNVYVAGTVKAAFEAGAGLVCGAGNGSLEATDVIAFNTGAANASRVAVTGEVKVATEDTKADLIAEVQGWLGFSETDLLDGYPAFEHVVAGSGTEDDPYQISSAADLQQCWKLTKAGEMVYFVQTADIDMAGMTDWHAFVGGDNKTYSPQIHYDGQNHLIKNFTSKGNESYIADKTNCYIGSIFGVLNGTVMNLGVVDADILSSQGSGILGGYAGHNTGTEATVDNVFVTGTVETSYYGGGMFGTMGNKLTLSNSFANVLITGTEPTKRQIGGIVGRTDNVASLTNVYVAGAVDAAFEAGAGLVCGAGNGSLEATDVIAFNTGAANASRVAVTGEVKVATEDTKAELIEEVKYWMGFSDEKFVAGYPALADFDYGETSGIFDATVEEVEANGPAVYYNLQGVQVANPDNGVYIVRRGNKVTKELIRK